MKRSINKRLCPIGALLGATLMTSTIAAQPAQDSRSTIQKLYDEANDAFIAGDFAVACSKLEVVLQVDPGAVGSGISLGECYKRAGRLASAWRAYIRAEAVAAAKGDQRAKRAREAAEALAPRLAQLTIVVPDDVALLPQIDMRLDGGEVPAPQWGTPQFVDKGAHVLVVSARGKATWRREFEVKADNTDQTITIQSLLETTPSVAPAAAREAPYPGPSAGSRATPAITSAELDESGASTQRNIGLLALATGGVGLAAGAVFGAMAISDHETLEESCPEGRCPANLKTSLRPELDSYEANGTASTVAFALGTALTAAGVVLLLTTPGSEDGVTEAAIAVGPTYLRAQGRF